MEQMEQFWFHIFCNVAHAWKVVLFYFIFFILSFRITYNGAHVWIVLFYVAYLGTTVLKHVYY